MPHNLILRFRVADRPGIVAAIAPFLASRGCDIRAAEVYGDAETGTFFCRMELTSRVTRADLAEAIGPLGVDLGLDWELADQKEPVRVLIAVSKFGHCLVDLIHKQEIGQLPIEIVGVVSNHDVMRKTVEWHGLPYHHLPTEGDKPRQEAQLLELIQTTGTELTVLARYMQILSDDLSRRLDGRCINIHHSFLPGFKGARPYHRAHERGVKLIGATAHFVTSDLDEGPIIEQAVERVDHRDSVDDLIRIGRDIEARVLARAVDALGERRVFLNGNRTVIFR